MPRCSKCTSHKADAEFPRKHKNSDEPDAWCRECRNAACTARRLANKEKHEAGQARWRAKYEATHGVSYSKAYREKNHAYFVAKARDRFAKQRSATPPWADSEFEQFFASEIYDLARVRTAETGIKWEVDHMVPIRSPLVCGLHCSANLQLLTERANRQKRNSHWPGMWIDSFQHLPIEPR